MLKTTCSDKATCFVLSNLTLFQLNKCFFNWSISTHYFNVKSPIICGTPNAEPQG